MTDVSPIVVTPLPIPLFNWIVSSPTGSNGPGDRDGGIIYNNLTYLQRPLVTTNSDPGTQDVANQLLSDMDNIWDFVSRLEDDQSITIPPGTSPVEPYITGYEVKLLFQKAIFTFTNIDYGPGKGGENTYNSTTGVSDIKVKAATFTAYIANAGSVEPAARYLIFHEIAHNTVEGRANANQNWTNYLARTGDTLGTGYFESDEGKAAERFANNIAYAISVMTGAGMWDSPPYGHDNWP